MKHAMHLLCLHRSILITNTPTHKPGFHSYQVSQPWMRNDHCDPDDIQAWTHKNTPSNSVLCSPQSIQIEYYADKITCSLRVLRTGRWDCNTFGRQLLPGWTSSQDTASNLDLIAIMTQVQYWYDMILWRSLNPSVTVWITHIMTENGSLTRDMTIPRSSTACAYWGLPLS